MRLREEVGGGVREGEAGADAPEEALGVGRVVAVEVGGRPKVCRKVSRGSMVDGSNEVQGVGKRRESSGVVVAVESETVEIASGASTAGATSSSNSSGYSRKSSVNASEADVKSKKSKGLVPE